MYISFFKNYPGVLAMLRNSFFFLSIMMGLMSILQFGVSTSIGMYTLMVLRNVIERRIHQRTTIGHTWCRLERSRDRSFFPYFFSFFLRVMTSARDEDSVAQLHPGNCAADTQECVGAMVDENERLAERQKEKNVGTRPSRANNRPEPGALGSSWWGMGG